MTRIGLGTRKAPHLPSERQANVSNHHFGWPTVVLSSLTGTIIAGANLSFMHRTMPTFADWLDQFARER